jgi:hypothetical protein
MGYYVHNPYSYNLDEHTWKNDAETHYKALKVCTWCGPYKKGKEEE